jgi:hypothetical protein
MRSGNPRSYARLTALAVAGLTLSCAGCASGAAQPPPSTTSSTTLTITTTTVPYVRTYVTVGHRRVLLPVEAHNEPISPYSSQGQNIIITRTGFEPQRLYAVHNYPIDFTNLTDQEQVVKIYNFPSVPKAEPIPPGGTFSFRYGAQIALLYGNASGTWRGHLYIDLLVGVTG